MPCLMDPPRNNNNNKTVPGSAQQFCLLLSAKHLDTGTVSEKNIRVSTKDSPTGKAEVALAQSRPHFLPLSHLAEDCLGLSLYGNPTARESGKSSLFSV